MNIPISNTGSIANYNKVFDQNLKQFDQNLEQNTDFDKILNNTMYSNAQAPVLNGNIELNVGLENMGITPFETKAQQESKTVSPVDKTAKDFGKAFSDGLNSVNDSQLEAQNAVEIMASGGDISAHEVMIAAEKANLTMNLAIQMRNKIVSAYNEINNVRV